VILSIPCELFDADSIDSAIPKALERVEKLGPSSADLAFGDA
jgi:hypothetical protein